ncbi:MAG: hypothetical protein KDK24_14870 [Pseudooceanicola sp.]|nr:hypothetical protein [Pseudooceanicola sp.]
MVASFRASGAEFLVNTYTKNRQGDPAIDADPKTGGFQIVWESQGQDGDGLGVYGQIFRANGTKKGGEFLISDMTIGDQENPDIAYNENGQGSWVWQTNAIWSPTNINRDEVPVARDFVAENIRTRSKIFDFEETGPDQEYYNFERVRYGQNDPEAAGLDAIAPRVISLGGDHFATGYYVRDFLHAEFQFTVDQYTANTDRLPTNGQWSRNYMDAESSQMGVTTFGDLAKMDDQNILVVGTVASDPDGSDGLIQFQIFEEPRVQGLAFKLQERVVLADSGLTGDASDPRVVMLKKGMFAITWTETTSGATPHDDVYVQVFKKNLAPLAPAIKVHTGSKADQNQAEITKLKDGGFMVTWTDHGDKDGDGAAIMAQRFDANGVKLGKPLIVNSTEGGDQENGAITTLKNGKVVITWESDTGDGTKEGVMAQMLDMLEYGAAQAQELIGTDRREVFVTGAKRDVIDAAGGNDKIDAGRGNDKLDGGEGNDVLIGRLGKDTFVFGAGSDTIRDFKDDVDKVVFEHSLVTGKLTANKLAALVEETADSLIFDFGGGNKLTVVGINDFDNLRDDLGFV